MPTKAQENVLPIEGSGRVVARHDRRIGTLLAEAGKLGARDIEQVMDLQQKEALRFGEAAHRLGLITENDLQGALAKQYDFPRLLPGNERINSEQIGRASCRERGWTSEGAGTRKKEKRSK